jgi:release factor glutamine methyltransferase
MARPELSAPQAVTLAGILAWARITLHHAGVPSPRREALLLWSELHDMSPATVLARGEQAVGDLALERFQQAIARRVSGEPRQYVVGTVGFRRLLLRSDSRALIPRPETEGLIELALAQVSTGRALDLGTGGGCIALALADEGSFTEVVGVDRSPDALELGRENGERTGLSVTWKLGDWTNPVQLERFDVVVANPPYIATKELDLLDPSVRDWEPRGALDGGIDGLRAVRRLLREIPSVTRRGGWLFMELDATRARETAELAVAVGWEAVCVRDDLFQRPRYLAAQWGREDA